MFILTFLNLKQKQHRTHLAGWQKLGLKSLWVIMSKGRVMGVDLTIGGPPSHLPGGPGARSVYRSHLALPARLHRHFNARQVAGCCYFEGAGGPGAPRATADPDRRRRLTGALGHRRGCARPVPVRSSPFWAREAQPRPRWLRVERWLGSCCWRPLASEGRRRCPGSPSARMC